MRCKILIGLVNDASDFLFNFVEKFAKMYGVPKAEWTYYTKQ